MKEKKRNRPIRSRLLRQAMVAEVQILCWAPHRALLGVIYLRKLLGLVKLIGNWLFVSTVQPNGVKRLHQFPTPQLFFAEIPVERPLLGSFNPSANLTTPNQLHILKERTHLHKRTVLIVLTQVLFITYLRAFAESRNSETNTPTTILIIDIKSLVPDNDSVFPALRVLFTYPSHWWTLLLTSPLTATPGKRWCGRVVKAPDSGSRGLAQTCARQRSQKNAALA